ncbi:protein mono-ADP-ribosyltransferase PARP12 isoform X4 [Labrus bergylta]|uniref:protein mono-ADP-ribosyltransferase PARP12 isoform X4 n=1 Tax=Labrus bergylta TaxID=56723 RepID=UPI003313BEF0
MATARSFSEEENPSDCEFDASEESDSDDNTDEESDPQVNGREPCKFYNKGRCRDGTNCQYLHMCKYALKGNCHYGSRCKLNHPRERRASSGARHRSTSTEPKLTDGRFYQWQLNTGNNWLDIENDHIIEAQYSLPHTKSIKLYNTQYGAVSIDFKRLKVYGKNLRVRRLDDGNTEWIWFCTLRRKWKKYGDKDSKGNPGPVKSSDVENKFQSNPTGSYTFNIGAETFEIKFKDMRQVGQNGKRKVTRRPLYRQKQVAAAAAARVSTLASVLQNIPLSNPQWQFEGKNGAWYIFKHRRGTSTECSVSSDDIERKYQQDPTGTMRFNVNTQSYELNFQAMTQTNLQNRSSRTIRRVLV